MFSGDYQIVGRIASNGNGGFLVVQFDRLEVMPQNKAAACFCRSQSGGPARSDPEARRGDILAPINGVCGNGRWRIVHWMREDTQFGVECRIDNVCNQDAVINDRQQRGDLHGAVGAVS